ncbi:MAG: carboxylesterase family protein [Solirubrobacteraceae bacterium]
MSERVTVQTPSGGVRGVRERETIAFRGIPYAVADRFSPPRPAGPWSGDRDALSSGPAAPQPDREVARFTHGPAPDADEWGCLNLNVFTPRLDGRRPVMVWLHGGGFTVGSPGATLYDATRLAAAADAVIVCVGYRLGSLGWLCHPRMAGAEGQPAGNWGLLDQIEALRWVGRSIAAFGGDPGNVTVAGQSAGALAALDMLAAPQSAGLFHQLIAQSPPLTDVGGPPEAGVRWAESLHRALFGDAGFDPQALRAAPVGDVLRAHEELLTLPEYRGSRGAVPTIDPGSLPVSPGADPRLRPEIPVLIGTAAQEGTFFFGSPWRPAPPPQRIGDVVAHLVPDSDPGEVLAAYAHGAAQRGRSTDPAALLAEIATDAMFANPVADWVRERSAGQPGAGAGDRTGSAGVYHYRVDHPGAGPALGATHTVEVPLLFGTWADGGAGERLAGQADGAEAVAAQLVAAWGAFLHAGDPGWAPADQRAEQGPVVFGAGTASLVTPSR